MATRAYRVTEIESWPECLELPIGSDHLYLLVDLDRCEFIDVVAVKLLVVAHALLSAQGTELLIFGATDQVRDAIEAVEASDRRVLR